MLFLMIHIGRLAGGADPSGGLEVVWTDLTTRELPGNYPGFGLAALGCLAWLSRPGKSLAS